MDPNERITITGISGRYPESNNVEEFADALLKGVDLVTVDDRRYPVGYFNTPPGLAKIKEIDKFDAAFFGIHPKQADYMDPRQRILNEVIYESIIDAGYNPKELRGSRTGVYAGIGTFSNVEEMRRERTDGYSNIGVCLSLAANRASYCFDFRGPSYSLDTACSSAMYAFVNAVKDIKAGVTDAAIVCASHLILHPHESAEFNNLNMLSADSKCKVFSTLRDGYARAEAISSVFLQKSSVSRRVYATVLGAGSNADGQKVEGITFPSSEAQLKLMKEIYAEAKVDPEEVVYVEAHGTGTPAGDTQELLSLVQMFCKRRKTPLKIGAVKSNMGHSETSSAMCSITKVLMAMESGIIYANLHTHPLDTELPGIRDGKLKIATEHIPWDGGVAALNSFGFGGANAHIILKSNQKQKKTSIRPTHRLVQVSGRTEEAVKYFLDGVTRKQDDDEFLALIDHVHTMNVEGHNFRGYTVLGKKPKTEIERYSQDRPVWFIYTGMGSQWVGMGRDLMQSEIFRNTIKRCAAAVKPYNVDLEHILTTTDPAAFDNIMNCFCAIGAMEIALTDVLYSLGIIPDNIAGHSLGEVACAYADGQITVEQGMLLAFARGYASQGVNLPPGQMAAIGLPKEECEKFLPEDVFIACHNGKRSVTITGPTHSTTAVVEKLTAKGVFARNVKSGGLAFHSKYIADAGPLLYDFVKKVLPNPKPRSKKWISTSVPEHKKHESWAQYNCAEYHRNNFCNPVLFCEVYALVPENAIVIEVAPHGLMQAILKREMGPNVTHIPLMNRASDDNEQFLLSSIGKIYLAGGQPNLRVLYPDVSFPVSRGTNMIAPLVQWDHSVSWFVPKFKNTDSFGQSVVINLSDEEFAFLEGHNIDGRVLMPATGYLELVWNVFANMHMKSTASLPVVIENVKFKRATVLPPNEDVKFLVNIMKQSGNFEVFEGGSVVATGKITAPKDIDAEFTNPDQPEVATDRYLPLKKEDLYRECRLRRYKYGGLFQGIEECDVYGLQGYIKWNGKFTSFFDTMLHLTLIENPERELYLPTSIEKLIVDPAAHLRQISDRKELPIFYNQALNTIKSGSVEIIGMESSIAPRRQQVQEPPLLESYEFIPYENSIKSKFDFLTFLQVALQIVLQNCTGVVKRPRISIVHEDKNNITEHIKKALNGQPLAEPEYVKFNPNDVQSVKYDLLVISEDVVNEFDTNRMLQDLNTNGFILYLGDFLKIVNANLQIVYQALTAENNVYLLRPNYKVSKNYGVVNVRNSDFDWLKKLKELIKSKAETVYLFSQGEDNCGVIGLVKCLLAEPSGVRFRAVLVEKTNAGIFSMDEEFYKEQLTKDLTFNVLRGGQWGTFVHLPLKPLEKRDVTDASISILVPGDLSTITWVERWPEYAGFNSKSEMIYVSYSALNFKDVMVATGKLHMSNRGEPTATAIKIGLEFSGITASGKRVMGLLDAESLSLQIKNDSSFTWEVPDSWSLEEAATVPCVYATCYYAMIMRGQMQRGESILIHAGSGGIGLAAISIALSMGCTVYTTVGSQEKRDYLKRMFPQLKDENIGNSRNSSFRRMIMKNTNRRGVDVILNSLSAELFQESLKCVAARGKFLEIGKVDFFNGTPIDSKMFLKNCSFHGVLLDDLIGSFSDKNMILKRLVDEGIKSGAVRPLPRTVFDETEVENALRFLSSGKHKGKVLIKVRSDETLHAPVRTISAIPKVYFSSKKSYIVIGGLGGVGLELTEWLIRKGAKNIVLNSRRNISNGYQSYCLKKWERFNGVTVRVNVDDTTCLDGAKDLIADAQELGPVAGLFNLALVLRDALVENQTKEMYEEVFKPKIISGQNMDLVTRQSCPELEHFVVFSSIACGRGNSGQTNYGMANSALERLCEKRRREKLPGLAVQWGPIGDVGALEKIGMLEKAFELMLPQNIYSCLDALERCMLQQITLGASTVLAKEEAVNSSSEKSPAETVAHILGIRNIDLVDKTITLSQLGLDSLMVAEIKQTLYRNYQLEVNVDEIRDLTFAGLIALGNDSKTEDKVQSPSINGTVTDINIISKETTVELNRKKGRRTVFFVHPIEGHVEMLREVAEQLNCTAYGLQCTTDADYDTVQDYARYFIQQIRSIQPKGPYFFCGYSYGAVLAFEMGVQLEGSGEEVDIISIEGSPIYVKNTLEGGFERLGKSVDKSQSAILAHFSAAFNTLDQTKVLQLLEKTVGWENQLQVISDFISNATGLDAKEISISADRFYKRCHAGYFYEPRSMLKGKVLLIRREDNEYLLSDDYDLHKVCKQPVEILKLQGDHRTILLGDNTKRISEKINAVVVES